MFCTDFQHLLPRKVSLTVEGRIADWTLGDYLLGRTEPGSSATSSAKENLLCR